MKVNFYSIYIVFYGMVIAIIIMKKIKILFFFFCSPPKKPLAEMSGLFFVKIFNSPKNLHMGKIPHLL